MKWRARDQRRVGDGIDVLQKVVLHFGERSSGGEVEKQRDDIQCGSQK